jgi:toxin ParE1/3/4
VKSERWLVRVSAAAEKDYLDILRWSIEHFGAWQARVYAVTLGLALEALASGPAIAGAHERPELGPELHSLHVARQGRKGRHFIIFQTADASPGKCIDVLRILHDRMELERHLE